MSWQSESEVPERKTVADELASRTYSVTTRVGGEESSHEFVAAQVYVQENVIRFHETWQPGGRVVAAFPVNVVESVTSEPLPSE